MELVNGPVTICAAAYRYIFSTVLYAVLVAKSRWTSVPSDNVLEYLTQTGEHLVSSRGAQTLTIAFALGFTGLYESH